MPKTKERIALVALDQKSYSHEKSKIEFPTLLFGKANNSGLVGGRKEGDLSELKGSSAHIELSNPVLPSTEKISHPWLRNAGQILYAVDNDGEVMLIRVG